MSDVIADGWDEVLHMSQTKKILASPAQYKDIITGDAIPNDRILSICKELDKTQSLLQEGRNIYRVVMRETLGSRDARRMGARQAHAAHAGGGYTQIWNRLCDAKMSISICVTAPPAETQYVAEENERRLLIIIYQCDQTLQGMCQDTWTSPKEIGTLSQTNIYVMYPYHLGEKLHKLCTVLDTVSVENHTFSAKVVTEGRTKLHHLPADVRPWEPHINGNKLQPLGKEEIIAATMMHPASCEESFMKGLTEHTYHLGFKKSIAGEAQSAAGSLWAPDWQRIKLTNKAWKLSQKLATNNEMQTLHAYWIISGLVIAASRQGMTESGADVFLYTCSQAFDYDDDQQLFMSTNAGDKILALDQPFRLTFSKSSEWFKLDDDGCIWAVYGLKYDVDGDKGIVIKHAGITMVQHLTSKNHQNQLHIFSGQMTPHIAQFSAKIAVKQSGKAGEPASSSNISSTNLLDLH